MPILVHQDSNAFLTPADATSRALVIGNQYLIHRSSGRPRLATILDRRKSKTGSQEAYVSYVGEDKRLDAWVEEKDVGAEVGSGVKGFTESETRTDKDLTGEPTHKSIKGEGETITPSARGRQLWLEKEQPEAGPSKITPVKRGNDHSPSAPSTPEREHASMTRVRNFEDVRFGEYLVKTWYYSPYPFPLDEPPPQPPASINNSTHNSTSVTNKRKAPATSNELVESNESSLNGGQTLKHKTSTRTASDMFAAGVGRGGEGVRGRLWACDLCFKYMRTRKGWERHSSSCTQLQPPGRKVYQRGSYTIWEVDGADARLYCQNLSLFGKLFIDHKSVFFHVENFFFYVLCDAATSRRDQVMAFFSKEKLSYDDYNLACIVTFPPHQNRGFGKLLIEFSYYLTLHPSTRSPSGSPGTPERPLSDLGLKSYTAYWVSVILRFLRKLLGQAKPLPRVDSASPSPRKVKSPVKAVPPENGGRTLRVRNTAGTVGSDVSGHAMEVKVQKEIINGIDILKIPIPAYKSQYSVTLTLDSLAKACHLRIDDTAFTLAELGLLQHRRKVPVLNHLKHTTVGNGDEQVRKVNDEHDLGEWKDVQVVISRESVDALWVAWGVRESGVLDEGFALL